MKFADLITRLEEVSIFVVLWLKFLQSNLMSDKLVFER